jgi:hypothetical protein
LGAVFGLAVLGVVGLQIGYAFFVFSTIGPQMATRGQFGDIFGGVNALFTGLAFAGVIYTILLQRQELGLQREELRLTRDELKRSADAQMEQVSQLKETANLSALTALLNVYSADLQPLREITKEDRRLLATSKAFLKRDDLGPQQPAEIQAEIDRRKKSITDQEAEYSILLDKHNELVVKLKNLVERVSRRDSSGA